MRRLTLAVLLTTLTALTADAQVTTHGMTVTAGPLIWSNSARLTAAQARYASSPSTYVLPGSSGGTAATVLQQAFIYAMTGVCSAGNGFATESQIDTCGDAIAWLLNTTDIGGGRRNEYSYPGGAACNVADYRGANPDFARYYGEIVILSYSWLRPVLSEAQRQEMLGCMVRRVAANNTDDWGAPDDHANNYNWGFMRNTILTALVFAAQETDSTYTPITTNCNGWTVGAGATAQDVCNDNVATIIDEFLDEALDVRWTQELLPWLNGAAKGGVLPESQNYGHYLFDYLAVNVMLTMSDYGRDMWDETNYWEEAAWVVIYGTSNRTLYPTQPNVGAVTPPYYQYPTYGNTQTVYGAPYVGETEEGNFMTMMAILFDNTYLGDRIRYWLTTVNPRVVGMVKVLDAERGNAGTNFSALPLFYCGTGFRFCYLRDSWAATGSPTMFFLEGEAVYNTGGNHPDCSAGSWQVWRGQRWVSKEASGAFSRGLTNLAGTAATNTGQHFFHNAAGINDSGDNGFCIAGGQTQFESPDPVVTRLQKPSDDSFFFLAGNYTAHKLANLTSDAALTTIWRDFVYVRHLNTLCTLDRVVKTDSAVTTNVYIHFPESPSRSGDVFTGVNVDEELKVTVLADTLADSTVTYTIRDESSHVGSPMSTSGCNGSTGPWVDCDPQHRVEVRLTGATTSYVPACAQAYSTGGSTATVAVAEDGDSIDVTITQTGLDTTTIVFAKGATSTGGQITIGSTTTAFASSTMDATADATGVSWGDAAPAPEAPRGRFPFIRFVGAWLKRTGALAMLQ